MLFRSAGFWLLCTLLLFLLVASILTLGALGMLVLVRFLLRARQEGPRTALFELADDARAQYALARGRQPGPRPEHDDSVVKKEEPESEVDSVVVVGSASPEQSAQTQADGSGFGAPGAPVDEPA